jgi:hypothetical protein
MLEGNGKLRLGFGEVRTVVARVTPPSEGVVVRFAMLGSLADAALDADVAFTDQQGTARVRLYAPNREASFALQGRLESGEAAQLGVEVTSDSPRFGTVEIAPTYEGGRPVERWVAQARPLVPCEALDALPPPPDLETMPPMTAEGSVGAKLTIVNVTPDVQLSVVVWGGPYVRGCQEFPVGVAMTDLLAASVFAQNVKLDLEELFLRVAFPLDPTLRPGLADRFAQWGGAFLDRFRAPPEAGSETARGALALLLAMQKAVETTDGPTAAQEFGQKIAAWQAPVAALPGGLPNAKVAEWLTQTQAAITTSDEPFLTARFAVGADGAFRLRPTLFFGLPFSSIRGADGVASAVVQSFELNVDASDRFRSQGVITFQSNALVARAILDTLDVTAGTDDFYAQLETMVSCPDVGTLLAAGGFAYGACNAECAAERCRQALPGLWAGALPADASGVTFSFSSSGDASFDASLKPSGWGAGSWVGTLNDSLLDFELPVLGEAYSPPPGDAQMP